MSKVGFLLVTLIMGSMAQANFDRRDVTITAKNNQGQVVYSQVCQLWQGEMQNELTDCDEDSNCRTVESYWMGSVACSFNGAMDYLTFISSPSVQTSRMDNNAPKSLTGYETFYLNGQLNGSKLRTVISASGLKLGEMVTAKANQPAEACTKSVKAEWNPDLSEICILMPSR